MLEITQIEKIVKQRYPFLFIDRVLELEEGLSAKGIKCVSINEGFFGGHFPGQPIMPGALILEAMAQLSAVALGREKGSIGLLVMVDKARFLHPVSPGDQLVLEARLSQKVKNLVCFKASAKVGDKIAAKAELGFIILSPQDLETKKECPKDK